MMEFCPIPSPGGEIGRRKGLKILFAARRVRVQVPPRAPELLLFGVIQGSSSEEVCDGAGDGIRTRDINLGKVALYQLSYSRLRV
jgi:hypothetical protein